MATKQNSAIIAEQDAAAPAPVPVGPASGAPSLVPSHHVILHDGVGSFRRGDVVITGDLGSSLDVQRLVDLEAIAPLGHEHAVAAQASVSAAVPPATTVTQYAGVPYDEAGLRDRQAGVQTPAPAEKPAQE